MSTHHEWVDSCADWAVSHPITRRAYIPQGCTQQGRHEATIEPKPPVDRVSEEYDESEYKHEPLTSGELLLVWLIFGLSLWFAAVLVWFASGLF